MALLFPLLLVGAVYFLMLRPQQQRVQRQRALISALEPGDEVVTAGGIVGHVRRLDADRIVLEVAPAVEITLLRGAIAQRILPPELDDSLDDDDDGELGSGDGGENSGENNGDNRVPDNDDRDEGFNGL
jgi:preprotein translocase subunit YajC